MSLSKATLIGIMSLGLSNKFSVSRGKHLIYNKGPREIFFSLLR